MTAAVVLADADLKKLNLETAYQRLRKIGKEWEAILKEEQRRQPKGEAPLAGVLTPACQRVALATLADARMKFVALVKAEDYAGLAKLKLSLEARSNLAAWGAGPALPKFLEGCDFILAVARDAGKFTSPKK